MVGLHSRILKGQAILFSFLRNNGEDFDGPLDLPPILKGHVDIDQLVVVIDPFHRNDPVLFCPMIEGPLVEIVDQLPLGTVAEGDSIELFFIIFYGGEEEVGIEAEGHRRGIVGFGKVLEEKSRVIHCLDDDWIPGGPLAEEVLAIGVGQPFPD